jgi:hypothetical protein
MIRAKDILSLLEEWKQVRSNQIEVLENPRNWREAVSDLRNELKDIKGLGGTQSLRFLYNPKTRENRVWVAYYATHSDIAPDFYRNDYVGGWISLSDRTVELVDSRGDTIIRSSQVPEGLERFLDGLKVWEPKGKNEEWIAVRSRKVEVLDDLSSWKEAVSAFKYRLQELKVDGIGQVLRFLYQPRRGVIKIWVGYDAVHVDVVDLPMLSKWWLGWIDVPRRVVEIMDDNRKYVLDRERVPVTLAHFIGGLRLGTGVEIDPPE